MVRRRSEVEQMNQKLAFVQEGLLSLINAIDSAEGVKEDLGGDADLVKPGPNDSCLVILAALQHRLGKLTHALGVFHGHDQNQTTSVDDQVKDSSMGANSKKAMQMVTDDDEETSLVKDSGAIDGY